MKTSKKYFLIVVAVVAVFFVLWLLPTIGSLARIPSQQQGVVDNFYSADGVVYVEASDPARVLKVNDQFDIDVKLSQKHKSVEGFNIPLSFDPARVELLTVTPTSGIYDVIYHIDDNENVVVFGLQLASVATNKQQAPEEEVVARLKFRLVEDVSPLFQVRKENKHGSELKFIDKNNKTLSPGYKNLSLPIRTQ